MKKSAFISDIIFAFFTLFLCTLVLFRYTGIALFTALILSAVCGTLSACAVGTWLKSKRKTLFLKKSDEAQKEKLLIHLAYLSDEQKTQFFLQRLTSENLPAKRFGKLKIYTPDALYLLRFSLAPVSADETLAFSRLKTNRTKTILCANIEERAYKLCQKLGIRVKAGDEVYALLKEKNALPDTYLGEESTEQKYGRRFRLWLSRANAKRFLVCSALLLLTALVSPFPYYYFVFGSILLLIAVLVKIFGYE